MAYDAANIAHLLLKHRITLEIVTKDAAVSVWTVDAVIPLEFRDFLAEIMHDVILGLNIPERFMHHLLCEVAEKSLEKQEGIEVFILPAGSIKEDTHVLSRHSFIPNIEETWGELGSIQVQNLHTTIGSLEFPKILLGHIY